jgi:hypothetical protein
MSIAMAINMDQIVNMSMATNKRKLNIIIIKVRKILELFYIAYLLV